MQAFDFSSSVFTPRVRIPSEAQVIFVADMFVEDYVGGAELTSEALIQSSPYKVFKLRSQDVTLDLLREGSNRFWIFGNFSALNPTLIPTIIANVRYSVLEYDYKYCHYRSPDLHFQKEGRPCNCEKLSRSGQTFGELVGAFYYGSMGLWWMSHRQKDRYLTAFPSLADKENVVLSSVFDEGTLELMADLRARLPDDQRRGWVVLGSPSWIKGYEDAVAWCQANGKEHEVLWGVPYHQLLGRLSKAEGFVYLPRGGDTCPRMVIEAKLLGCELHLNDNVQHHDEPWFATDELQDTQDYLRAAPTVFWSGIKKMVEYQPTVSGYVTTYNCVKQQYPFVQCIESMLQFCDEVCVVDGGSTDDTLLLLIMIAYPGADLEDMESLMCDICVAGKAGFEFPDQLLPGRPSRDPRIKVKVVPRDWSSKRHPVFDGMQKAAARAMCTKEFCWQMDSDEVIHEADAPRIAELCRLLPKDIDVMSLPVIEYWGGPDKVRVDVQPWKWRLSRNLPHVTHGIPKHLRRVDSEGNAYAAPGTDGCDMIHAETGEVLPHVSFYPSEAEGLRQAAMAGNEAARGRYEQWFNQVVSGLPSVFHYSWYDLERKIRLYRDYWTKHWVQITGGEYVDSADQNMMFDVSWSHVTEQMIRDRAIELRDIGGWIWHRKWRGEKTPWIKCHRSQPHCMSTDAEGKTSLSGSFDKA